MGVVWVVVAVVVVAGIVIALFGWDRYRGGRKAAGDRSHAQPTGEVFVDPATGRQMRVWFDRDTGRREYRPELPPDPALGPEYSQLGRGWIRRTGRWKRIPSTAATNPPPQAWVTWGLGLCQRPEAAGTRAWARRSR